jgi:L-amino acid N-acyltransferase
MHNYRTRVATKADLPDINEITNDYIVNSTATYITEVQTLEDRLAWFNQRSEQHPAVVVEDEGQVIAWGALNQHNPRGGYRHTAEPSVYVHRAFHRRGIGRLIVIDLIKRARVAGHRTLIACCCSESVPSIELLESLGFQRVGRFSEVGRKFERWLDNIYLQVLIE